MGRSLPRVFDVAGRHASAVLKACVGVEVKLVDRPSAPDVPRRREVRHQLEAGSEGNQAVEHLARVLRLGAGLDPRWVEVVRLAHVGHEQLVPLDPEGTRVDQPYALGDLVRQLRPGLQSRRVQLEQQHEVLRPACHRHERAHPFVGRPAVSVVHAEALGVSQRDLGLCYLAESRSLGQAGQDLVGQVCGKEHLRSVEEEQPREVGALLRNAELPEQTRRSERGVQGRPVVGVRDRHAVDIIGVALQPLENGGRFGRRSCRFSWRRRRSRNRNGRCGRRSWGCQGGSASRGASRCSRGLGRRGGRVVGRICPLAARREHGEDQRERRSQTQPDSGPNSGPNSGFDADRVRSHHPSTLLSSRQTW